ncbi:Response regulator with CheY-like receiver domain and winged-helix DNA-binding domain [Frankia canadensis]|uniref:Response regulator with CheY-like receiver domain and winged-helix DNA-binding domain n=1 Tax=Frankia canadensis TaxID=1836972 RepID=A0A2I2L084_9ACTN|nr:response regulator transcription factor [Frankia canadensis]SNQ51326.1 Response regulator with CheY-like receiver domain and winged-helix DNA-binding domain [Frankia canadensis]SOU58616.1 Response regulator with CheY-like receiver domain and winged-helix DNA-binding domain [Frankia canadensis]
MGKVRTTLLLVGAEAGMRRDLVPALIGEGYDVDVTRSGEQALALLADRPAHLVLSCLPLPAGSALPLESDLPFEPALHLEPDPCLEPDTRLEPDPCLEPHLRLAPDDLDAARLDELVYGPAGAPSIDRLADPADLAEDEATRPAPDAEAGARAEAGAGAEMDGLEFCRRLRAAGDVPLVMVAGRSAPADVVAGLEAGADDHVTAPPVTAEVLARLRALLRRVHPDRVAASGLSVGDLQIRPAEGIVRRRGEDQHLTRTEFRLLCELAVAGGRAVSRKQLLERVWGYDYFGGARMLDVHVRRLRRKLEMDPSAPTHILTVRGIGYRVCSAQDSPTLDPYRLTKDMSG